MRTHEHQMALITSEMCALFSGVQSGRAGLAVGETVILMTPPFNPY